MLYGKEKNGVFRRKDKLDWPSETRKSLFLVMSCALEALTVLQSGSTGSLSGPSPFCQLQLKSRKITGYIVPSKATNSKTEKEQHQPRCSLPESAGGG